MGVRLKKQHMSTAIWQISHGRPLQALAKKLDLEKDLEKWIEAEPRLVSEGLDIILRQVSFMKDRKYRPDLVGLGPQGEIVIIEIKRGSVNLQSLDQVNKYKEVLQEMPTNKLTEFVRQYLAKQKGPSLDELLLQRGGMEALPEPGERRIETVVVGTAKDPNLMELEKQKGISLVVVFSLFKGAEDDSLSLIRELRPGEKNPQVPGTGPKTPDWRTLLHEAHQKGTGREIQRIHDVATGLGLYPRLWKGSIMITPPRLKSRMLFTAWFKPVKKKLRTFLSPAALCEFLPVDIDQARKILGVEKGGFYLLTPEELEAFLERLKEFMKKA